MTLKRFNLFLFLTAVASFALVLSPHSHAQSKEASEPVLTLIGKSSGTLNPSLNEAAADEISDADRQKIWGQIDRNISSLAKKNTASVVKLLAAPQTLFAWPLKENSAYKGTSSYTISNFVDHNPAYPNSVQDYQCGARSYDTAAGYNHAGTDIALWPDSWNVMASGLVDIVAAAPGRIVFRQDGNADQSCKFNSLDWNAVYVLHDDGSIAWYGHMKRGSPTSKQVGERVVAGEYLGKVGSSGNSTGPHLHFEVYDANRRLIDPYIGQCNTWNSSSWWIAQKPYQDLNLNRLYTATAPPKFSACGASGTLSDGGNYFEKSVFAPGEYAYFMATYRDFANGQTTQFKVYQPDGSIARQWQLVNTDPFYSSSYWYWSFGLGSSAPVGSWIFEATYNNNAGVPQRLRQPFIVSPIMTAAKRGSTDITGSGKGSLLLRSATGQLQAATLVNNVFQFSAVPDPGDSYRLVAAGDFDSDGKTDLAYQDTRPAIFGDVRWRSAFQPANDQLFRAVKLAWIVEAVADLDGDGYADMAFRFRGDDGNPNDTGVSYIWFANGNAVAPNPSVTQVRKRGGAPLNWTLLGAVDLNGDNAADMIYISPSGAIKALMATADRTCANLNAGNLPLGFTPLKLGDFSGNRLGDMLLHNVLTGAVEIMSFNALGIALPAPTANPDDPNASCTASSLIVPSTIIAAPSVDPTWRFYAAADLDGDGIMDIVWRQPDGTLSVWLMNAKAASPTVIPIAGIAPVGYSVFQP